MWGRVFWPCPHSVTVNLGLVGSVSFLPLLEVGGGSGYGAIYQNLDLLCYCDLVTIRVASLGCFQLFTLIVCD